jgi:hypothetical protein
MTKVSDTHSHLKCSKARPLHKLALAVLIAALWFPGPGVPAGRFYKWVDEHGQVRYGDRLPPKYAKRRNETLNSQGIVVETRAAQKTPEQLAEERRLANLKADEERKRREQAQKDRILLDTFTTEDEMILTRDGKIEAIEAIIRVTRGRIDKSRQRLARLTGEAADLERAGRPVPAGLTRQIADTHSQIRQNLKYIDKRRQDQHAIRVKFERDIQRFRELKTAEAEQR